MARHGTISERTESRARKIDAEVRHDAERADRDSSYIKEKRRQ